MRYDWDEAKRLANLDKHGYDFRDAKRIYENPNVVTLKSDFPDESRYVDLAMWGGKLLALVYTKRGDTVRCISLRIAKRSERKVYHEKSR